MTFGWTGSAFTPDGGDAMGVAVSGDADQAFWASSQVISALVITAGGVSYNVALDFPETVGSVSPHNYSVFGGASMDALAFCVGEKTSPDTTTSGPSIELSKTAECATVDANGMATVTGTITAELDSRRPARITTALDTILGPGDVSVHMESVGALVGQVLTELGGAVTVDYAITFDPGDFETFDNFIEVTIEDAETGEDRMKIYNARAAFELCDEGPPPSALGSITIVKDASPDAAQDFAFTTTGEGLSAFSLDDDPADATLANVRVFTDLADGTYTVVEAAVDGWTLTSLECSSGGSGDVDTATATITLVAAADVTCTFGNIQQGGEVTPGNPPRDDTAGGNPLPDTALPLVTDGSGDTGSTAATLGLLAVIVLSACGRSVAVRARRRA